MAGAGGFLASPMFQMILGAAGTPSGGNAGAGALAGLQSSANYNRQAAATQLMRDQSQNQQSLSADIAKILAPQQQQAPGMLNTMQNLQGITGYQPQPVAMAPPPPPPQMMMAPQVSQPQPPPAPPPQAAPAPPQSAMPPPSPTPQVNPMGPSGAAQRPQMAAGQMAPQTPMLPGMQRPPPQAMGGMGPGMDKATMGKLFKAGLQYPQSRQWAMDGLLAMNKPGAERWRPMTGDERTTYGLKPGVGGQMSTTTGKASSVGGSGVNIDMSETNPLDEFVKPSDLERYVGPDGQPPDRIMTHRELRDGKYRLQRKPTEADRRSSYVADSLSTASEAVEDVLSDPDFDPSSVEESARSLTNWTASSEYQRYKSASDEWATNMVFLRSGATAREEEKSAAFSNFWPQPGDKKTTRDFKTRLRLQQEINAFEAASQGGRISQEKAQVAIKRREEKLKKLSKPKKESSSGEAVLQFNPATGTVN